MKLARSPSRSVLRLAPNRCDYVSHGKVFIHRIDTSYLIRSYINIAITEHNGITEDSYIGIYSNNGKSVYFGRVRRISPPFEEKKNKNLCKFSVGRGGVNEIVHRRTCKRGLTRLARTPLSNEELN